VPGVGGGPTRRLRVDQGKHLGFSRIVATKQ
jgi:hypothetical protein